MTQAPPPETEALPPAPRRPVVLRGTTVNPGLVLGPAHRKDHELSRTSLRRVPLDQVEHELNRFHQALSDSKRQLGELKKKLRGVVPEEHVLILDTHLAYLKDSVFLSDVENLILNEQMSLEGAITKVISDFDRIFRLVQSDALRERAVDLRDVGIRVLRNLERTAAPEAEPETHVREADHVLVARELSIVDMFDLNNQHVRAILTEAGSLTGHAAILARSMRIPTLTAVEGLLEEVAEGDSLIVDASEGLVRVRPDEMVLAQYRAAREKNQAETAIGERPEWARLPARTVDGAELLLDATAGNLPEVEEGLRLGLAGVGLYRTELLYLIDREQPSVESLVAHYRAVLEAAGEADVTFRLLDVDSSLRIPYLHDDREPNPALGRLGVRVLLEREGVLRRQLQAILRAASDRPARIVLPKVRDVSEVRRVQEILFEERFALSKAGIAHQHDVEVGAVIELPAAVLGVRDLAAETDFLALNLASLQQYLLCIDRANTRFAESLDELHPLVLRAVRSALDAAADHERPLALFGLGPLSVDTLSLLLGIGARHFSIVPGDLRTFLEIVGSIEAREASRYSERALGSACRADLNPVMHVFGGGLARP
jgi:phosphotransferase system enzyme I (PtsI)